MHNHRMLFAVAAAATALLGFVGEPAAAQTVRAEIHGGWDRASGDVRKDGLLYGAGLGVDFRLGRVTAGLEADADFSTVDSCAKGAIVPGDKLCVAPGRDLSAVGRIGFDIAPKSRLYALAGYTNARVRVDYTPATGAPTRESENLDGLRVGAGFQQDFGHGLYSKIEYRYSNYQSGFERHQVLAGLGIAF